MEARSILEKFRQRRNLLTNLRENAAKPRLKGMWNFLETETKTWSIISNVPPVYHLIQKATLGKPVEAETHEEIVGVGLYIMEQCRKTDQHITSIIYDLGIGSGYPKPTRQSYVDDAMEGFINPALDYVERELEELAKTKEKPTAPRKSRVKDVGLSDETADEATIEEASIAAYNIPDQPTRYDALGFEPYTTAISEFLSHEDTKPPLTLSIEGDWGSGKSSFMLQLIEKLKERKGLIVQFSAWRHECEDSLWAAFAESFLSQVRKSRFFLRRWWGDFILFWRRFSWRDGWIDVVRSIGIKVAILLVSIGLVIILVKEGYSWFSLLAKELVGSIMENANGQLPGILQKLFGVGGVAGALAGIAAVYYQLKRYGGNPIEINLRKYLKCPDYEGRISFVENFHNDFEKIVRAYAGKRKVYVFIDDVDRCVPPKAADLMQAINLMISDNPRLIFIIGMDREKVAAGLAVKHEKLIPYITSQRTDTNHSSGLEYGYSFIEKFIQLPFDVPRPTESDIENLIDKISETSQGKKVESQSGKQIGGATETVGVNKNIEEDLEAEKVREQRRETLRLKLAGDSPKIREIVLMVAPVFDYNPRRVKQFINLFRLRVYIASETGLFDILESETKFNRLTLEQLGKFVAIIMKWPFLVADLNEDNDLLKKLTRVSEKDVKNESEYVQHWFREKTLMNLIEYCPDKESKESDSLEFQKYTLLHLEVKKLLEISPKVSRVEIPPEQETYTTQEKYKAFYSELLDRIKEKHPEIKRKKALPQSWLTLPIGHAYIHLEWAFHGRPRSWFEVGLHFEKAKKEENEKLIKYFRSIRDELEEELGGIKLEFQTDWGTKWARIYASKQGGEMTDELKDWAVETALKFYDVFKPRLDKFIRNKKGGRVTEREEELRKKLKMPVEELGLSMRVRECFESIKLESVGQLVVMTEADLLKIRSFGKTDLRKVKRRLADLGLSLGMTV